MRPLWATAQAMERHRHGEGTRGGMEWNGMDSHRNIAKWSYDPYVISCTMWYNVIVHWTCSNCCSDGGTSSDIMIDKAWGSQSKAVHWVVLEIWEEMRRGWPQFNIFFSCSRLIIMNSKMKQDQNPHVLLKKLEKTRCPSNHIYCKQSVSCRELKQNCKAWPKAKFFYLQMHHHWAHQSVHASKTNP